MTFLCPQAVQKLYSPQSQGASPLTTVSWRNPLAGRLMFLLPLRIFSTTEWAKMVWLEAFFSFIFIHIGQGEGVYAATAWRNCLLHYLQQESSAALLPSASGWRTASTVASTSGGCLLTSFGNKEALLWQLPVPQHFFIKWSDFLRGEIRGTNIVTVSAHANSIISFLV